MPANGYRSIDADRTLSYIEPGSERCRCHLPSSGRLIKLDGNEGSLKMRSETIVAQFPKTPYALS